MRSVSFHRLSADDRPSFHRFSFQGIHGPVRLFRVGRLLIVVWP